jgi:hypothetical protein
VSASTALGLHSQTNDDKLTSFISELKRHLFMKIFRIDKSLSLFTGRPPLLSCRYMQFRLPLDISEEVMMHREGLEQAVQLVDPNGWDAEGKVHPSTSTRAHGFLDIILDEILELSLGDSTNCTEDRIKSVPQTSSISFLTYN